MNHFERIMELMKLAIVKAEREVESKVRDGKHPLSALISSLDAVCNDEHGSRRNLYNENAAVLVALRHWWKSDPASIDNFNNFVARPDVQFFGGEVTKLLMAYGIDARRAQPMLTFLLKSTWHLTAYEFEGKKCYQITDGLARQLRDTELRGLTAGDLRLPYLSVYIEIPHSLGFKLWNHSTGWHQAEGVYVREEYIDSTFKKWRFMFVGSSKRDEDPLDDAVVYFDIDMRDGQDLDEILSDNAAKFEAETRSHVVKTQFEPMLEYWQQLFRWVINVVIYATYPDAKIDHALDREYRQLKDRVEKLPKGEKRDKLKERLRGLSPQERMVLGRGVIYVDRHQAEELEAQRAHRAGTKPTVVTRVSGHWKYQVYGPGRLLRKRIFIEPYWRNLEGLVLGEGVHRLK